MTSDMHDPEGELDAAIERIAGELRVLPAVNPAAKARVLVALAAERAHPDRALKARRRVSPMRIAVLGAAAAALVATVVRLRGSPTPAPVAHAVVAPVPASPVNLAADEANAPVAVQLVVRAPAAARVAVVGDFTGWEQDQVAMVRDPASGLWSATVRVRPGRHVYAFVADDSVWMRDPRAPIADDADFGRPGSLLLVGRP